MEQKNRPKLPSASLTYLLICAALVLGFLAIGIFPSMRNLRNQDVEISKLQAQMQEQKALFPIYKSLMEKARQYGSGNLVLPSRAGLPSDRVDEVPSLIGGLTRKYNLELVSATPDVKCLADNYKYLSVRVIARGDFFNFRKFLLELDSQPFLEHTEELQIRETTGGKEFKLKIWLEIDGINGNGKA